MNETQKRLVLIYKGRLIMSVGFCLWILILSLMVNREVFFYLLALSLFACIVNQPLFWSRWRQPATPFFLRVSLYLDLIILTLFFHFFGGIRSGPLLLTMLLTILYASVVVRPREGILAVIAGIVLVGLMTWLEEGGIVRTHAGLIREPMQGFWPWTALLSTIMVVLLLPAHVGTLIYRVILERQSEINVVRERFSRLFTDVWEPVMVIRDDQTILRVNPAAEALFRRPAEELVGKKIVEALAPETSDDFAAMIHDVKSYGHVAAKDLKLSLPDGAELFVEISASIYILDREHTGIFLLFHDVTEQRQLEAELKRYSEELYRRVEERTAELEESREHYLSLFEKAAVPLCWLDPSGRLLSANRAFGTLTGLDQESEKKQPLVEFLARETDQARMTQYLDLMRKGYETPGRFELLMRKKEGGELWTEWFVRFEPLTDQFLVSIIDISERKKMEAALRQSEEMYRVLVETSPDSIVLTDLQGKVVMANPQAGKIYGVRPEEMIGKSAFDFIVPEDRETAGQNLLKTLETGTVRNVEYRLFRTDGSSYHSETSASLIRDHEGKPRWFIGITRDISSRKKMEKTIRESEERYRGLFEESRDVIYLVKKSGDFVDINPAAVDLFGYTREELLRMNVVDLYVRPEERRKFVKAIEEKGFVRDYELQLKKKDGTMIECVVTSTVRRDAEGKILGYQGIIRDMTERIRWEAALKESEERYRFLAENVTDVIWMMDMNLRYTYVSPSVEKYRGFTVEESMAQPLDQVLTPSSLALAMKIWEEESAREAMPDKDLTRSRVVELEQYCKDGSTVWGEAKMTFLRDPQGKAVGILGVTRDISERKEMERVKEEFQARLLEAEKMAMAGQLATGVAHEINNPLTAITYYSQALEKALTDAPAELTKLQRIQEAADRIQGLLSRLINYTSLRRAEFTPVALNTVVRQVTDALAHELEKRPDAKLVLHLADPLAPVQGEPQALFYLVSNLIMNALQSLARDRGKVTVSTRQEGSRVILEVKDTGVGIPEEDLPNIFLPFFTRRPSGQGSGLGLAIVQQVANLHRATVEVHSRPGKGVSFKVSFPCAEDEQSPPLLS